MNAGMTSSHPTDIAQNLAEIESRISAAMKEAGRTDKTLLTAVSKMQGEENLRAALAAGIRIFGENRVQEAKAKWPALREEFPDIELRLIGPLQSNKAGEAVALFDVIETIDRPKIAKAIAAECKKLGRTPRLLVQINTGGEAQKAGVSPQEADNFIKFARNETRLDIEGLMCIPPADEPPAPHFALLAKIASRNGLCALSMGMSGDYETAVALGATNVRVGTALFGRRD